MTNEVIVTHIPEVNFDFELACSSVSGVQFTDLSTVENADLVAWTWLVDGEEMSIEQNPNITFESAGIKTIRLVAQSSNGCESVYEEDIEIRSSPEPNFSFDIGCQGEISTFTDITIDAGNPIIQWMWTIEGVVYNTQEVDHVFNSNGLFDVTLEVTAEDFCSEKITKTIEVQQPPNVAFSIDGHCSNDLITLTDNSTDFVDKIVSRNWKLNDQPIGNGLEVLVDQLDAGTYHIELEVETDVGCFVSQFQDLVINPTPIASFNSSKTYGLPGDRITFTNTSTGGSSYEWLIDNNSLVANEIN
jgi:PKD repeat protein